MKKLLTPLIVIALILSIAGCGADPKEEYRKATYAVATEMMDAIIDAGDQCHLIYEVWYNSIYEKSSSITDQFTKDGRNFHSDFNTSLGVLFRNRDFAVINSEIKKNQEAVFELMKEMQEYPADMRTCYDAVEALYSAYYNATNSALNPSGTLNTYRENCERYLSQFSECYNKVKMFFPDPLPTPSSTAKTGF